MSRLTEKELDELRRLNPPDDPRIFRRFLDTIDALEQELLASRAATLREAAAATYRQTENGDFLWLSSSAARDAILALIDPAAASALDSERAEARLEEHLSVCHLCRFIDQNRFENEKPDGLAYCGRRAALRQAAQGS